MQKKWYIIYTKPHIEKKICSLLSKKKQENYFAQKKVAKPPLKKGKIQNEPLFPSQIFVYTTATHLRELQKMKGVISIMHWKDQPAFVMPEEIQAIKNFTNLCFNVNFENSTVNIDGEILTTPNQIKSLDGKIYSFSSKFIRLKLPSLGYILIGEVTDSNIFNFNKEVFNSKTLHKYQAS